MNLKKLMWIVLLLPVMASNGYSNGYGEWTPDDKLLQDLWGVVTEIMQIDPKTPRPEVEFLEEKNPNPILGTFYLQENKIRIWLGNVRSVILRGRCDGCADWKSVVCHRVLHEMIHSAQDINRVPLYHQHRQMKDRRYLKLAIRRVDYYFQIGSEYSEELSERNLEKGIDLEIQEENARLAQK